MLSALVLSGCVRSPYDTAAPAPSDVVETEEPEEQITGNEPAPEEDEDIVVPSTADTGGLFKNLNISRTDYLVTGIGLFLVVGIGSIVFISKHNRSNKRRK